MDAQATLPASAAARRNLRVRNPGLSFDQVPRHWFGGSAVATHIANGANLLFPAGERFFVRSVRHFLDRFQDDPVLLAQVRGFFGQEGRHASTHERQMSVLEEQGYSLRPFLDRYEHLAFEVVEKRASPELNLAVTVALEHFTAIMAHDALSQNILDVVHPEMQKLLKWHAAEEIEHKSVAFDVLRRVNPSYALRMKGLALATVALAGAWIAATLMLLRQDGVGLAEVRAELRAERARGEHEPIARRVFLRGIRAYVRPDFHPAQVDDFALADAYLAGAQLA